MDSEARRIPTTPRHSDGEGSCRADGCGAGLGADLRGRSAARAIRLPGWAQRSGRRKGGPEVAELGAYGGSGRRSEGLFR